MGTSSTAADATPPLKTHQQVLSMFWVEFGCAGHGKGPWDGFGAVIKQCVRRAILHNKILTASGYITSPAEVAEHLHRHFSTAEWQAAHVNTKVNEVIVLYSDATAISERASVERSKFDPLELARSMFSYLPLALGVHARRQLSCFCMWCFGVRGRGEGTADSNLCIKGCACNSTAADGSERPNPQHAWFEQECQRSDALGIAERRTAAQREGRRLVGNLKPGMWLASQDRRSDDTLWIGQAVKVKSDCIHKSVEARSEWIAGAEFNRGDYAIAVKWWIKTTDDPEELTYEEWQPTAAEIEAFGIETSDGVYFIVNSTELRHVGFQMDAVSPPPSAPVPVASRTRRASAVAERPSTAGRRFRLPPDVENQILAHCW